MDRYDQEVERLTARPEKITWSWHLYGPLFGSCGTDRTGTTSSRQDGKIIRCLTMIRLGGVGYVAELPRLTQEIRRDSRIPTLAEDIKPHHLPVFAERQRWLDRELGRQPPPLLPEPGEVAP
jgi:hypothetical protein